MSSDPATPLAAPIGREADRRVEAIATAVAACPLVVELHSGRYGQVATYLPGRRVLGVRRTETELAIHVVARYPAEMATVANQVRSAVSVYADGLPIAVTIEDLQLPAEPESADGVSD